MIVEPRMSLLKPTWLRFTDMWAFQSSGRPHLRTPRRRAIEIERDNPG